LAYQIEVLFDSLGRISSQFI